MSFRFALFPGGVSLIHQNLRLLRIRGFFMAYTGLKRD
jgi:hypothetical protein